MFSQMLLYVYAAQSCDAILRRAVSIVLRVLVVRQICEIRPMMMLFSMYDVLSANVARNRSTSMRGQRALRSNALS